MKKQNGITLVALVVTIIVLLILAGVSISMISGDDGIATQAGNARTNTKAAQIKEAIELAATNNKIAMYSGEEVKEIADVAEELEDKGVITEEEKEKIINSNQLVVDGETIDFGVINVESVGNLTGNVGVEKPEYIVGQGFEVNYNELDQLLSMTGCYYVQIKADIAETIKFYVKLTSDPDTAYVPTIACQPYNLVAGGHSYPGAEIGTSKAGSYSAWDTLAIKVPDKTNDYTVKVEYVYADGTVEYATSTKPVVE